jgi:hypothetical protein
MLKILPDYGKNYSGRTFSENASDLGLSGASFCSF